MSKTLQVHREQGCWAEGDAVRIAALARNDRRGLRLSLLILLILGVSQDSALARPKQVELQWGDLSPLIIDKKVTLQLPDDVTVKGRVLAVRDDGLYIDIKKRNKKKAYPKGPTLIPRADVHLIRVKRGRGVKYRAILTPVGAVLGAAFWVGCVWAGNVGSGQTETCGIWPPITAGLFYLLGRDLDIKFMHIKVVDDRAQTGAAGDPPARE